MLLLAAAAAAALSLGGVAGDLLPDEKYYEMPPLFHLDDPDACLSRRGALYCVGAFDLAPLSPHGEHLYQMLQEYSADENNFNHSRLHRGYCVSSRCGEAVGAAPQQFEWCVANYTARRGLEARLRTLDYCRRAGAPQTPLQAPDLAFALVTTLMLIANFVGTLYDIYRNKDQKPNKLLMAWSARANWNRLTASYDDGDPRLSALNPIQGMKAITLILVMLAHTSFTYYITYLSNPLFLEKLTRNPLSFYFYNGTAIVQTFVMLSSFLLAYNLLLSVEKNPKKPLSLMMFPQCLMHRFVRIVPVYMWVVWLAASWWRRLSDGALWPALVVVEAERCRRNWWTHLLFINNLMRHDEKCLIQSWFLAVDMQLYCVSAVLTLALGRWPRTAMRVFAGLLLTSILGIFFLSYFNKDYISIMFLMKPEKVRKLFSEEVAFNWLYITPWGSAASMLLGLLLAFTHHRLQQKGVDLKQYLVMRIGYRVSVPAMFAWVVSGYWLREVRAPLPVALFTALDRPVFVLIVAVATMGFFYKIDSLWWRFLSWRGWQIIGRMSLSVLMLHWLFNMSIVAGRSLPSQGSILNIGADWVGVVFLTYVSALATSVLIEFPMQRFLQAVAG